MFKAIVTSLLGLLALASTALAVTPMRSVRTTAMSAWLPTARCESTYHWHDNTGNGEYGGLQFDIWTWNRFGGQQFARRADLATPHQQVVVASRVTYDAWPHCPEPPITR